MTKAGDPKTLPEVDKKDADEVSEVFDFLQSLEWQEMLEKARAERERNLAARKQENREPQAPKPTPDTAEDSTSGKRRPAGPKTWSDRLEEAREQREEALARRAAESENRPADTAEGAADTKLVDADAKKIAELSGTLNRKKKESANDHEARKSPKAKRALPGERQDDNGAGRTPLHSDARAIGDGLESDQLSPPTNASRSAEKAANSLRKRLFGRLAEPRQERKTRLSSVAFGCALGVIASVSVYVIVSQWGATTQRESASLEATETPVVLGEGAVQSATLSADVSDVSGDQALVATDVLEALPRTATPDSNSTAEEELNNLVSLSAPSIDNAVAGDVIDPETPHVAPFVGALLPAIEPPPALENTFTVPPRPEVSASLASYPFTPEGFAAVIALPDEEATITDTIILLADAITPLTRPPDVSFEPTSLISPARLAFGEERGFLPTRAVAYQPEAAIVASTTAALLASLQIDQPEVPLVVDPAPTGDLTTVSLNPSAQPEDIVPQPSVIEPRDLTPRTRPNSDNDTPPPVKDVVVSEPIVLGEGTEFRLFAPRSLSSNRVESVLADLTANGHEAADTARVGFGINQTNVRFYHRQDEAKAAALAKDAGAVLRDFTGSNSKAPSGIIELWLAGESSGSSSSNRRSTRSTPEISPVNQLRNEVLKKLKTATNQ